MKMTDKQKEVFAEVVLLPMIFILSTLLAVFVVEGFWDLAMASTVTPPQHQKTTINNVIMKTAEKLGEMPSPAVEKALHSVNRQYCLMDAESQGRMQHRLAILGIKTPVRTGIYWPLVMYYHRVCAPTKADLRIYEEAHVPMVKAVRDHFHVPVWNIPQAINFCAKWEGVKHWDTKTATFGQLDKVEARCFSHKK